MFSMPPVSVVDHFYEAKAFQNAVLCSWLNSVVTAEHAAGGAPVAGDVSQADSDMNWSVFWLYFGHWGVRAPFGLPLAAKVPSRG
jgi:hypothetical protein